MKKNSRKKILVLGAGKVGHAIALILTSVSDYSVVIVDKHFQDTDFKNKSRIKPVVLDIHDKPAFKAIFLHHQFDAIISSLPYYLNSEIAQLAFEKRIHYFDLTEDVKTTEHIAKISKNATTAFVPQCGLAPGFINILANHLMQGFERIEEIQLRVGALPQVSNNALKYALTWSTEGLINEYGNPCEAIVDGQYTIEKPLEGLETILIDGVAYEAFHTSGGLGSLWKKHIGKVKNMNYKTLRYPGHCEKMQFLMNDLHMNTQREMLKAILEKNVPTTHQDVVIISVLVSGDKNSVFLQKNYTKKLYPKTINEHVFPAIQYTTAIGVCSVLDIILFSQREFHGLVHQEAFALEDIMENRFGQYYA